MAVTDERFEQWAAALIIRGDQAWLPDGEVPRHASSPAQPRRGPGRRRVVSDDERRRRQRERQAAWKARHPERRREQNRAWKARRKAYDAAHGRAEVLPSR